MKFNPGYNFDPENDFIVYLLVLKKAMQPVYEELIQSALKNRDFPMNRLIIDLKSNASSKGKSITESQGKFLDEYFIFNKKFGQEYLYQWMVNHPTLA